MQSVKSAAIAQISGRRCFERLAGKAVMVTATRSLARRMGAKYSAYRVEKGDKAWPAPVILPFGAWTAELFNEQLYSRQALKNAWGLELLDDLREELLWEYIISRSKEADNLLAPGDAARSAREAWRLCRQWKAAAGSGPQWSAPDPAAFAGWAASYQSFCRQKGWIDTAGLPVLLADRIKAGADAGCPEELILAGFDEFSPAQLDLFRALQGRGTNVCTMAAPCRKSSAMLTVLDDDVSEIRAAALWARSKAEQDPSAKIGIVSPGLASNRAKIDRIFSEVFHPASRFFLSEVQAPAFQISAAPPLCDHPVADAAGTILQTAFRQGAEVLEWSRLLRMPFTAGADSEYASRAALDAVMRKHGDLYFTVSGVARQASALTGQKNGSFDLSILSSVLERIDRRAKAALERQKPEKWAKEFSELLADAGWPGERTLSSNEYQAVCACNEALVTFAGTGAVTGMIPVSEALGIFSRSMSERPFQPEQPDAGVRIAGLFDSAGEEFDALWIMGLHNEQWPPPARPNPFIPAAVQRRLGMPHSSPERELSYAGLITERLLGSADEVICSFGRAEGESLRLASPLVEHLGKEKSPQTPQAYPDSWAVFAGFGADAERITDASGAPVNEGAAVSGGTGIMKSQALCPFQAYARYRLGACSPEAPEPGLKPRQRGVLVHRVLELLWGRLKEAGALGRMPPEDVSACIADAVNCSVSSMAAEMPGTFTQRFTRLETLRLQNLMEEWIEAERGRAHFSVEKTESRLEVEINGIRLSAVADRIDRLDDGRLVIIDYKTGQASARDWFAERIAEPQLPLYSMAARKEGVAGVFFARVKKGGCGYTGIAETEGIIPQCRGVKDDGTIAGEFESIAEVIQYWETGLSGLASEIRQGYAAVLPVKPNRSCRYCDLSPMCRIWEISE